MHTSATQLLALHTTGTGRLWEVHGTRPITLNTNMERQGCSHRLWTNVGGLTCCCCSSSCCCCCCCRPGCCCCLHQGPVGPWGIQPDTHTGQPGGQGCKHAGCIWQGRAGFRAL